jgi:hypothetical protein
MHERTISTFEALAGSIGPAPRQLTARQMRKVRALARTALAERGIEASIHADHLQSVDGRSFGLENLASKCHTSGLDEDRWGEVVDAHIGALLTAYPEVPGDVPADELTSNTYVRLQVEEALPSEWHDHYRYVRRLGGGLIELLVHRDGDTVRWLRDEDLDPFGADKLREVGLRNVRRVKLDEHLIFDDRGMHFHVVRGESGFGASKLLVLPDLLGDVLGRGEPPRDGVVFAVPSRYELAFAPVEPGIAEASAALWSYSSWGFSHRPGPLSPYLYWWRDGEVTQLSYFEPSGRGRLHRNLEFEATIDRVTPGGFPWVA